MFLSYIYIYLKKVRCRGAYGYLMSENQYNNLIILTQISNYTVCSQHKEVKSYVWITVTHFCQNIMTVNSLDILKKCVIAIPTIVFCLPIVW